MSSLSSDRFQLAIKRVVQFQEWPVGGLSCQGQVFLYLVKRPSPRIDGPCGGAGTTLAITSHGERKGAAVTEFQCFFAAACASGGQGAQRLLVFAGLHHAT